MDTEGTEVAKFSEMNLLIGHSGGVTSLAWSPDGTELASSSSDGTVRIWDPVTGNDIMTMTHTDEVTSVVWSPDGTELASASYDHTIKIWDTKTGIIIKTLDLYRGVAQDLAWSPNENVIASGDHDYSIRFWNVTTGINIKSYIGHTAPIRYIGWSQDGNILASVAASNDDTASWDNSVKIWNVTSDVNFKNLTTPDDGSGSHPLIGPVALSPNGKRIVIATRDSSKFQIYNISNNSNPLNVSNDDYGPIYSVAWSRDGEKLATGFGHQVIIYNPAIGAILKDLTTLTGGHSADISGLAWSPDGSRLASGSMSGEIIIWGESQSNVYISSITVDKANIIIGESSNITVKLANNGTADGLHMKLKIFDGSKLLMEKKMNVFRDGTNSTMWLWKTNETYLGRHLIRAVVEKSEKNLTIIVNEKPRPNVYVMDTTVGESNITVGKSTMITATIANNGTADATDVNVSFYADKTLLKTMRENITKGGTVTIQLEWTTKNTTVGDHVLKVVVGNSSKQITVHVNKHPAIILNYSISAWLIGLIILLIVIISLILGYDAYKKGLNK